jgi:hypothetical protein
MIYCKKQHIFQTLHFNLDENGRTTVHPDLWEMMKRKGITSGFKAMRLVAPQPTIIGLHDRHRPEVVISQEHGVIRVDGKDNPDRFNGSDLSQRIIEGEISGELSV